MSRSYTAKDIEVLEGLEPVRKRPAMYIGGVGKDGFHHLLIEIVDNAVDEALNGFATTVEVSISEDRRSATVTDNGRGIPVDVHPRHKLPAVTLILTTLHSGGKFSEGSNYQHSAGLHGVGSSVVNALSEAMEVRVRREGSDHVQAFARGKPQGKLKKRKAKEKGSGTRVTFTPDPEIFGAKLRFDVDRIRNDLDDRSFVHRGVRFVFTDERSSERHTFVQKEGIKALLARATSLQKVRAVGPEPFELTREAKDPEDPISRLEVVLTWTDAREERLRSYANGVLTRSGGTHETGLRAAVTKAIRSYIGTHKKAVPPKLKVTAEDIREGLMGVVNLFIGAPQFQGQTKAKLNNPEVQPALEAAVYPALEAWLNENVSIAEAVLGRIVLTARQREASRDAAEKVRKDSKGRKRAVLPDKLAACSNDDPRKAELFIVEGDSAGGSAKQGRNRKTQAVLPLRGKVLNSEQASLKKVLGTRELADIIQALGCGVGDSFDLTKLNYSKVILLMDADSDGDHIATLLLTFFFRYLPQLIEAGHLYVAKPPLFKIQVAKKVFWAANEAERDKILAKEAKTKQGEPKKAEVFRFKGLGEMMPAVLAETTLDPKTRTLLQVDVDDMMEADRTLRELMGKDPAARFQFIMDQADEVADLDV